MTRLLVLGMLELKPMSGYDIKQALQMTDAERWGGVLLGSIYHALKKMEQEGYVSVASIEQTGHRQKAIYSITDKGKQHLKQLTREALAHSSVLYPTTLYSGLSFYDKLTPQEAREALQQQQIALEHEHAAVIRGWEEKNEAMQRNIPPMMQLTFDHMLDNIRLQQDFVEKALKLLDSDY